MWRINGFGTTYLGMTKADQTGRNYATVWFTCFFFPIFPIARHYIQKTKSISKYLKFGQTPLVLSEVLRIYLFGWIIFPLIILAPYVLLTAIWPDSQPAEIIKFVWILLSCIAIMGIAKYV